MLRAKIIKAPVENPLLLGTVCDVMDYDQIPEPYGDRKQVSLDLRLDCGDRILLPMSSVQLLKRE